MAQSCGSLLVFQDSDDVMLKGRVNTQVARCRQLLAHADATGFYAGPVVGCLMRRDPPDATPRYAAWVNRIDGESHTFPFGALAVIGLRDSGAFARPSDQLPYDDGPVWCVFGFACPLVFMCSYALSNVWCTAHDA